MLAGYQRSYLRSLAHALAPAVQIGKGGLAAGVVEETRRALDRLELVKVRFHQHKEERRDLARELAAASGAELVGTIGNLAILYREQPDPEKRAIRLPRRDAAGGAAAPAGANDGAAAAPEPASPPEDAPPG